MATEDWNRVADYVEARLNELRMTRKALADTAGVDVKTVGNFLDRGMKPQNDSRGGYEAALDWAYGSLRTIARGGEPTSRSTVGPDDNDASYTKESTRATALRGVSDEDLAEQIRIGLAAMDEMRRRQSDGSMGGAS
jgi:hypothetical protein